MSVTNDVIARDSSRDHAIAQTLSLYVMCRLSCAHILVGQLQHKQTFILFHTQVTLAKDFMAFWVVLRHPMYGHMDNGWRVFCNKLTEIEYQLRKVLKM